VKRPARIGVIVVLCLAALGVAVWLNLPSSLTMLVQAIGQQRHPIDFDLQLVGVGTVRPVQVELRYVPQTPILGITEHYWSLIAPLHIDNITQIERVQSEGGRVRFAAPLGLVGLSGYRLQGLSVHVPTPDGDGTSDVEFGQTYPAETEPAQSDVPAAHLDRGSYEFDGPLRLWGLTGYPGADTGLAYSPRATDHTRAVIWPGLRAVRAAIDFAPYPIAVFAAPVGWQGFGWHGSGVNLARSGATLSDQRLDTRRGARFAIPFSGDCGARPQVAVTASGGAPAWSHIDGRWRPVDVDTWDRVLRSSMVHAFDLRIAGLPRSLDDVAPVEIAATRAGSYRLFTACRNPHYRSVAVTWIDVNVR
jgi:hypothetical protein